MSARRGGRRSANAADLFLGDAGRWVNGGEGWGRWDGVDLGLGLGGLDLYDHRGLGCLDLYDNRGLGRVGDHGDGLGDLGVRLRLGRDGLRDERDGLRDRRDGKRDGRRLQPLQIRDHPIPPIRVGQVRPKLRQLRTRQNRPVLVVVADLGGELAQVTRGGIRVAIRGKAQPRHEVDVLLILQPRASKVRRDAEQRTDESSAVHGLAALVLPHREQGVRVARGPRDGVAAATAHFLLKCELLFPHFFFLST